MRQKNKITICTCPNLAEGTMALTRGGKIVWTGPVSTPVVNLEIDGIIVNRTDAVLLLDQMEQYVNCSGIIKELGNVTNDK